MLIDDINYSLGLDVWEGSLEIQENVLQENDVTFLFIRINDMNGGHHLDSGFQKQWDESSNFIRIPYFVYNPWVDGITNANYLLSVLPSGVTTIAIDIEVRKDGYSPIAYAKEVDTFMKFLIQHGITPLIYTGSWFYGYLAYWPTYVEYWWARYPYALYPPQATNITWDELKRLLITVSWSPNNSVGDCSMWQCSGDRFILPGTLRTMDIDVFKGSPKDMIILYKIPIIQQPQSGSPIDPGGGTSGSGVKTVELTVQKSCNIRPSPNTNNTPTGSRSVGTIVNVDDIYVTNWEEVWVHDKLGWSALIYYGTVFMK
jgi:GH25 family lysozyme M1 (1,4-beta-N-acetylmuramidase)